MKKIFWILPILCFVFSLELNAQENMSRRRHLEEGIHAIGETNLAQPLNETQEIGDVSVTIVKAYADTGIVILWYMISGLELPEGQIYGRYITANLYETDGSLYSGWTFYVDPQRENNLIYGIIQFSHNGEYPEVGIYELELRLTIGDVWQNFYLLPEDYVLGGDPIPEEYRHEIPEYGEYSIELRLNVLPTRFIWVDEIVESNGIRVYLRGIFLRPFFVTVDVCYEVPSDDDWVADARILVDDMVIMNFPGAYHHDLHNPIQHCSSLYFTDTLPLDARSLVIEIPRLMTSIPHTISPELAVRAEAELAELGIIVDYVENGGQGINYEVISLPEEYEDVPSYLIVDALREEFEGDWSFEVELPESLFGE